MTNIDLLTEPMYGRAATYDVTQHSMTFDNFISELSLAVAWLPWKLRLARTQKR